MSRYNTQVLSSIRMLCRMQNIDEKVLYERAKLILSIYREVCWSTIDRANDVCDTLICTYGDSLDGALIYLENFAPDEARERFEERIRSLFETKWIIELVDMAMLKIREYPDKGALYCEIISKAYLNRFKYRESEMLEVLNMERSTVPFPVSWTVKMKKKQKETQDILSYHTQAAGCSDKARAKASGGRQPIEECGRTGL